MGLLSCSVKQRLARNIQILQEIFLQDLQDLAINLASLALKMKLFLQDIKDLTRNRKIIFLQDFDQILRENYFTFFLQKSCKIFISCIKTFIFSARLARYVQDLMQDLASFARKILARLTYFLQEGFYWEW